MRPRLLSMLTIAALATGTLIATPAGAAYPGANGRIAFVRANQVYTITPAGAGLTKLTTVDKNYRPRWSPDGKRIAYVHETATGAKDIWVMHADGAGKTQVTHLGNVTGPSWSPDGQWIAFGTPLQRIRSAAPFGVPQRLLAGCFEPGALAWPVLGPVAWSANGRWIAFYTEAGCDSPDHFLQVMDLVSHEVAEVDLIGGACCGEGYFADPAFSASSGRLAYTTARGEFGTPLPPPTIRVVSYPANTTVAFTTRPRDKQLAFSPNGAKVVLVNDTGGAKLIIANANGSGRRVLTTGYNPDWQPLP